MNFGFTEPTYEYGELELGSARPVVVTLENRTSESFDVTEIMGSCGCMSVVPSQCVLDPAAKQEVYIHFSTFSLG